MGLLELGLCKLKLLGHTFATTVLSVHILFPCIDLLVRFCVCKFGELKLLCGIL